MGFVSESNVIDLSKPLERRSLDAETQHGLNRAVISMAADPCLDFDDLIIDKPNPMLAGYGPARKETKV